jgi:hypothetical protein
MTDPRQRLRDAGYTLHERPIGNHYPAATRKNVLVCDDGHERGGRLFIDSEMSMDALAEFAAAYLLDGYRPERGYEPGRAS